MSVRFNRIHLAAAIGMLLAVGCGLLLHEFRVGAGLINRSYDWLTVRRGHVPVREAAMVYLDEDSHLKLGQPLNAQWDRSLHARLIDRLTAAGARAIVFDVVFSDSNTNNPAGDERLVAAIKRSGRVILAADNVPIGVKAKQTILPFDALADSAAAIGSAELAPSGDLIIRRHMARSDNPLSSLSWVAAEFVGAKITQLPNTEDVERWMNYYGPPNFIPSMSYYKALNTSRMSDEVFRDKVVFVGARLMTKFAGERKDEYPNPFSL